MKARVASEIKDDERMDHLSNGIGTDRQAGSQVWVVSGERTAWMGFGSVRV
jgi:hypothetical protein